jgi:methyl-accepting chemotaxis protein
MHNISTQLFYLSAKANQGKEIASNMINGYKELNQNITNTINLISDIEMSSKEQLSGIEQINDAVTQLDQQTQQNAAIASQAHDVALVTDGIAKSVLKNAEEKEFKGKANVKGKNIELKSNHVPNKNVASTIHKKETVSSVAKNEEDEWENF